MSKSCVTLNASSPGYLRGISTVSHLDVPEICFGNIGGRPSGRHNSCGKWVISTVSPRCLHGISGMSLGCRWDVAGSSLCVRCAFAVRSLCVRWEFAVRSLGVRWEFAGSSPGVRWGISEMSPSCPKIVPVKFHRDRLYHKRTIRGTFTIIYIL